MAKSKKKLTPFEKLAQKRGVDLEAEKGRATRQKKAGERIEGTTKETLSRQEPKDENITLTTEQTERIKAGTLKATPETTEAVKTGKVNIQDPSPRELAEAAFGEVSNAIAILPIGRFWKTSTKVVRESGLGQEIVRKGIVIGRTGIAANSVTNKQITSIASKTVIGRRWQIAGAITVGLIMVKEILQLTYGGKNFGEFIGMEEAAQTVGFSTGQALKYDDFDAYDAGAAARDEVLKDEGFWETVASYIPFLNVARELEKYRESAIKSGEIMDKLAEDRRIQIETGESDREYFEKRDREKQEQFKANLEATLENQRINREETAAAEKAQAALIRKGQKENLAEKEKTELRIARETVKYWEDKSKRDIKRAEEERIATAEFWLEYYKQLDKIKQDRTPSNLNFGLI